MSRKYQPIWEAVKTADVGTEVQVKCHGTAVTTLQQAVFKEKSIETASRKKLGMRFAGKLRVRVVAAQPSGYAIVFFKLEWDGTKL